MKKNILFLITDDQRFDTIQALGNTEIKTPNLDKLVERGTSFTNAFIPGGTCGAVCMPSRAMIHTGKFLTELTDLGEEIPENHAVLGECLREKGYQTSGVGKWHNGTKSYHRSFSRGNSIFFGGMWDHWNVPINHYDRTGKYKKLKTFIQDPFSSNKKVTFPAEEISLGNHSTDLFADTLIEEIKEMAVKEEPFFLYGSFLAPHDPRTMPEEFQKMYNPDDLTIPTNFLPLHSFGFDILGERDETLEKYPREPQAIKQHLADYYAMISHIDSRIGDIVSELERFGIVEDTLIVFCGDNGLSIGQHGLMGKQNLYDCSIRVPLLFAGPSVPKNKKINEKVLLMDIMPTLLEYAEISIPETITATSFWPLITEKEVQGRSEIYLIFTSKIRGLITDKYKFLDYRTKDGNYIQLFDRHKDQNEKYDLSNSPKYQKIINNMQKRMENCAVKTGDKEFYQGKIFWESSRTNGGEL